jgi:hypothetical protein
MMSRLNILAVLAACVAAADAGACQCKKSWVGYEDKCNSTLTPDGPGNTTFSGCPTVSQLSACEDNVVNVWCETVDEECEGQTIDNKGKGWMYCDASNGEPVVPTCTCKDNWVDKADDCSSSGIKMQGCPSGADLAKCEPDDYVEGNGHASWCKTYEMECKTQVDWTGPDGDVEMVGQSWTYCDVATQTAELPMCECKSKWQNEMDGCESAPTWMTGCPTVEQMALCEPDYSVGDAPWCETYQPTCKFQWDHEEDGEAVDMVGDSWAYCSPESQTPIWTDEWLPKCQCKDSWQHSEDLCNSTVPGNRAAMTYTGCPTLSNLATCEFEPVMSWCDTTEELCEGQVSENKNDGWMYCDAENKGEPTLPICTCKNKWKNEEGPCADTGLWMNGCPSVEMMAKCEPEYTAGDVPWCETNEPECIQQEDYTDVNTGDWVVMHNDSWAYCNHKQQETQLPPCTCQKKWKNTEDDCAAAGQWMFGCPTREQLSICDPNYDPNGSGQNPYADDEAVWCETNEQRCAQQEDYTDSNGVFEKQFNDSWAFCNPKSQDTQKGAGLPTCKCLPTWTHTENKCNASIVGGRGPFTFNGCPSLSSLNACEVDPIEAWCEVYDENCIGQVDENQGKGWMYCDPDEGGAPTLPVCTCAHKWTHHSGVCADNGGLGPTSMFGCPSVEQISICEPDYEEGDAPWCETEQPLCRQQEDYKEGGKNVKMVNNSWSYCNPDTQTAQLPPCTCREDNWSPPWVMNCPNVPSFTGCPTPEAMAAGCGEEFDFGPKAICATNQKRCFEQSNANHDSTEPDTYKNQVNQGWAFCNSSEGEGWVHKPECECKKTWWHDVERCTENANEYEYCPSHDELVRCDFDVTESWCETTYLSCMEQPVEDGNNGWAYCDADTNTPLYAPCECKSRWTMTEGSDGNCDLDNPVQFRGCPSLDQIQSCQGTAVKESWCETTEQYCFEQGHETSPHALGSGKVKCSDVTQLPVDRPQSADIASAVGLTFFLTVCFCITVFVGFVLAYRRYVTVMPQLEWVLF